MVAGACEKWQASRARAIKNSSQYDGLGGAVQVMHDIMLDAKLAWAVQARRALGEDVTRGMHLTRV